MTFSVDIHEYIYEPMEEDYTFQGCVGEFYETMPTHGVVYKANIDDSIEQLTIYNLMGSEVADTENLKNGIFIINEIKNFD